MPHVGEWKDETEVIVALIARPQMEGAAEELLSKGEPEAVNVVCGADPLFQSFSTLMREEFLAGRATDTLLVEATGTILSAWLVRRWSGVRNERRIRGTLSRKQLERTLELVKDRFSGSLQVADLAGELGMGVHQFTRHFRESVGCTPYRYIIDQRVERARYLLTATSLPIAEIAIEAGFVSQSHLTETFQRRLNITPNVLRKSI
jgi:AraC family transcriptional regulator